MTGTETAGQPPALAALLEHCFRLDVAAFKPGNVSLRSPGHGMCADDFLRSAAAAAPALAAPGLAVGARIRSAMEATWDAVGCNTNLGILLLSAPLVQAALGPRQPEPGLRGRLARVLRDLDRDDAEQAFAAIRLANPAGLGHSDRHDVRGPSDCTLAEAMAAAAARDRVARQYATVYHDVFLIGVPILEGALLRGWSPEWAMLRCYLALLGRFPDSHVQRKHGARAAESVREQAWMVEKAVKRCENPRAVVGLLLRLDKKLKRDGFNPGTSADLTVASLVTVHLQRIIALPPAGTHRAGAAESRYGGVRSTEKGDKRCQFLEHLSDNNQVERQEERKLWQSLIVSS